MGEREEKKRRNGQKEEKREQPTCSAFLADFLAQQAPISRSIHSIFVNLNSSSCCGRILNSQRFMVENKLVGSKRVREKLREREEKRKIERRK